MEKYAKNLAIEHRVLKGTSETTYPIDDLIRDYEYITRTYDILNDSISNRVSIPPSGEWILDNYYMIEEQVNILKKELTLEQYVKLPGVNKVSRIYIVAKEIVEYTDCSISEEIIELFVKAYQTKKTISMKELWLLPVMLKVCIIHKIREVCERIIISQKQKFKVESIVERLIENKNEDEQKFQKYRYIKIDNEATAFIEHLIYSLKKYGKEANPYLQIIEDEVNKTGTTIDEVVRVEHYDLALRRVTIANGITSIRNISRLDWTKIFERINIIEEILSQASDYGKLDFNTRNIYRNEITKIAQKTNTSEKYVAMMLVNKSKQADMHIGEYLIGDLRYEFLKYIGYREKISDKLKRFLSRNKLFEYLIAIYIPTILFSILLFREDFWLAIIPLSEIFVYTVNKIITKAVKPQLLPRVEKIDSAVNTFVIVPTLLNNTDRVIELIKDLEVYYLSNKMDNLFFALLRRCIGNR